MFLRSLAPSRPAGTTGDDQQDRAVTECASALATAVTALEHERQMLTAARAAAARAPEPDAERLRRVAALLGVQVAPDDPSGG
jgi:hypothetical protein